MIGESQASQRGPKFRQGVETLFEMSGDAVEGGNPLLGELAQKVVVTVGAAGHSPESLYSRSLCTSTL